jgi:glutamate synthase (NADPH/NADH) large chain
VPVNNSGLGEIAISSEPSILQVFISARLEQDELERKLYIVRKKIESEVRNSNLSCKEMFYIPSLSTKILVYKGMFTPYQLAEYYPDLCDPYLKSAIALVH